MQSFLNHIARVVSSRKGSRIVVICWLAIIIILSAVAPGAKEHAISSGESSIHNDTPSAAAKALLDEQFPSDEGLVALLVFHGEQAITTEQREAINEVSEWLSSSDKPLHIASAMPFHHFPSDVQDKLFSEDKKTVLLNIAMHKQLESAQIHDTLEEIRAYIKDSGIRELQLEITGPAGIAADTIAIFSNADLVLLFSTIGLILVILMIIYRSPLLAIIPLLIAGMVYQTVDKLLGLAAQNGWIVIDKQALSIMMILLFAILTDYCLFILSRFREELGKLGSKHDAMKATMSHIGEPILFSGGTVLIAVIVLFTAVFQPYHNFAPVFAIAIVVILFGGLTLIPAVFTLAGKRAFWPFVPKLGVVRTSKSSFWTRLGLFVTKKPAIVSGSVALVMLIASLNVFNINFSFNLMKSFPEELSSRQGFELLEEQYPKGQLAPVTVLLKSGADIELTSAFVDKLADLTAALQGNGGVEEITPIIRPELSDASKALPRNFLSEEKKSIRLQMILQDHPYEPAALQTIEALRENGDRILRENGFDPAQFSLHYAGQTAEQLDVRDMNQRDTILVFSLITILISIMLLFQSRSIIIALTMIATMLLSYAAALGLSWTIFSTWFGYDAVSYRLPMYSFVFLIALGIDYNIMLVSRIMEEAHHHSWKEAIQRGVAKTGGVISSAGIVLAATFCVLMTQPLQELFLFGFIMAIGILMDTFLIRGMLLPAILTLIQRWVK